MDHYVFATDERIMEMIAREVDYGKESKEQYRKRKIQIGSVNLCMVGL